MKKITIIQTNHSIFIPFFLNGLLFREKIYRVNEPRKVYLISEMENCIKNNCTVMIIDNWVQDIQQLKEINTINLVVRKPYENFSKKYENPKIIFLVKDNEELDKLKNMIRCTGFSNNEIEIITKWHN